MWYLELVMHRSTAIRLIQTALVAFGMPTLSCPAAAPVANPPAPLVTNVVAQRTARDTIQTLLQVTAASNVPASVNGSVSPTQTASPGTVQWDRPRTNTDWRAVVEQVRGPGVMLITNPFAGFVAGSLADTIWSSFHLEGRSTKLWEFWQLPAGWPSTPPVLRWNTNSLIWGYKGMTAISQVCEGEGAFGQGSITALTRRHGYLRGHSMGPSGLHPEKVGVRVWFCTRDNQVIERKVKLLVTRFMDEGKLRDYSILLFDADLPATIEPMRVTDPDKVRRKYLFGDLSHKPVIMTLQGGFVSGFVSGGVAGWTVPVAGGDSGAPRMLPLAGELVFLEGISTSPPSADMQADMDMLSRKAGLDPRRYQMQWVDLDSYPDF
jgi:hypothetical protein